MALCIARTSAAIVLTILDDRSMSSVIKNFIYQQLWWNDKKCKHNFDFPKKDLAWQGLNLHAAEGPQYLMWSHCASWIIISDHKNIFRIIQGQGQFAKSMSNFTISSMVCVLIAWEHLLCRHHLTQWSPSSGPWFNIKMSSYQYRKSHCGDKTVVRSSYLHNGISYTGKMSSLYWIRAQVLYCTYRTSI